MQVGNDPGRPTAVILALWLSWEPIQAFQNLSVRFWDSQCPWAAEMIWYEPELPATVLLIIPTIWRISSAVGEETFQREDEPKYGNVSMRLDLPMNHPVTRVELSLYHL